MPRPIIQGDANAVDPLLPMEYTMAQLDTPDAYIRGARVQVIGLTVRVLDRGLAELRSYTLDEAPTFDNGALIGTVDGVPFTVSHDPWCGCTGTQMEPKNGT